jgi:hypothetical protein
MRFWSFQYFLIGKARLNVFGWELKILHSQVCTKLPNCQTAKLAVRLLKMYYGLNSLRSQLGVPAFCPNTPNCPYCQKAKRPNWLSGFFEVFYGSNSIFSQLKVSTKIAHFAHFALLHFCTFCQKAKRPIWLFDFFKVFLLILFSYAIYSIEYSLPHNP